MERGGKGEREGGKEEKKGRERRYYERRVIKGWRARKEGRSNKETEER